MSEEFNVGNMQSDKLLEKEHVSEIIKYLHGAYEIFSKNERVDFAVLEAFFTNQKKKSQKINAGSSIEALTIESLTDETDFEEEDNLSDFIERFILLMKEYSKHIFRKKENVVMQTIIAYLQGQRLENDSVNKRWYQFWKR